MAAVVPGYYQNEFALSSLWNYMYTYYPNAQASAQMWFALYDQYMSMDFDKLDLVCPGGNGWPVVPYDVFTIDRPLEHSGGYEGPEIEIQQRCDEQDHRVGRRHPGFHGRRPGSGCPEQGNAQWNTDVRSLGGPP